MDDNLQILSLLSNDRSSKINRYSNYENLYITDSNNNNYNNQLMFDTMLHQKYFLDYANATIEIPVKIGLPKTFDASGNLGTEYPKPEHVGLAFKNNVANIITGLQLKINNVDITNTQSAHLLNHISTMFDSSKDWAESTAIQNGFFKDDTNTNDKSKNTGFSKRIEWLKPYYVYTGDRVSTIELLLSVPLRELSTFFESLQFPLYNCRVQLYLNLSNTPASSNPTGIANCFMVEETVKTQYSNFDWMIKGNASSTPDNGYIQIGSSSSNTPFGIKSGTYLVIPKITHSADVSKQLAAAIKSDKFIKSTQWVDQKVFYNSRVKLEALGNKNADLNFNISSGIKKPTRVYMVMYDASGDRPSISSHLSPAPCATSSSGLLYANLEVNNVRLFNPDLNSDQDIYNIIKRETPAVLNDYTTGSLISFNDVLTVGSPLSNTDNRFGIHKYFVFDLHRMYESGVISDQPVSLRFTGKAYNNVADNAMVDVFFIVESEVTTEMNFSNTNVAQF